MICLLASLFVCLCGMSVRDTQVRWTPPFWYVKDKHFDKYEKELAREAKKKAQELEKKRKMGLKILKRKELLQRDVEKEKRDYSEQLILLYEMKDKIQAQMRKDELKNARNDRMKKLRDKIEKVDKELAEYMAENPEVFVNGQILSA